MYLKKVSKFAKKMHDDTNCTYDGKSYYTHVEMVEEGIDKYKDVFISYLKGYEYSRAAASCHDLIEDARLTFNNVKDETNADIASIVLKVTDVPAETRLLRHLLTMPKTVLDYRAIIVKMADLRANAMYSKNSGSSMYKKYKKEYLYRRPIFKEALKMYEEYLNIFILEEFWNELDEIHEFGDKICF